MSALPELVKMGAEWRSPSTAPVTYRLFHFKLPGLAGGWYLEIAGAAVTDPAHRRYVTDPGTGTTSSTEGTARFASKSAALAALAAELERRAAEAAAIP